MSDPGTTPLGELLAEPPEYGANASALPPNGSDPRYLRITDIDDAGRLLHDDVRCIPSRVARQYLLCPHDIVIARTGNTVGKSYIHDDKNGPLAFAGYLVRFRLDKERADPSYVFQYLHSPLYWSWVGNTLRTGAQPNVNASEYKQLPVPAFRLPQQRKIARILTTLDELIEKTEALIAKYQAIKQGMMHDLFTRGVDEHGHLRPTYDEAPELYKESELGWIPTEWEADSLGSIADLQVGYAFKSAWFRESGGTRLLRGENVGYGTPDWKDTQWLPSHFVDMYQEYLLSPNDVIIGMDRTFTKSGFKISQLREKDCPALLVQRVGKFMPSRCNAAFLRALLGYDQYHFALRQQEKGMDIPHLSQSEILAPRVPVPPKPEQARMADRSLSCRQLIEEERVAVAELRLQKSGLMQDLLTGKVRVKLDEEDDHV